MLIIGVDPSLRASGIALVDNLGNIVFTTTLTPPEGELRDRLQYIYNAFSEVLRRFKPSVGVMESTIYHRNVKTALTLGAVRGVFILAMSQADIPVKEISPTQVKLALTGQGRAKKKQVAYMVKKLLNAPDGLTEHEYDALAVCFSYIKGLKNAIRLRR